MRVSAERFGQVPGQVTPAEQAGAGEADIEIADQPAQGEAARPLFKWIEPVGGVAAADHGADRSADDDVGLDARLDQRRITPR